MLADFYMNSSWNEQLKINDDPLYQIQKSDLIRFQEEKRRLADREVNVRKDLRLEEERRMPEEKPKWENELNRQKYVSDLEDRLGVFIKKEMRERDQSRNAKPLLLL